MKKLAPATLAAALLAAAPAAHAISMRDDVPNVNATDTTNPYVALGASSAFNAVGFVQFTEASGSFDATGMLVASTTPGVYKFLTAAHNVDNLGGGTNGTAPDGKADATQYQLYFGAATSANGSNSTAHVTVSASSVSIDPQWVSGGNGVAASSSQYDLAVMTFNLGMVVSGTLPTTVLGFSNASPLGKTGTIVGYGTYGTGNAFAGNAADGVRRAGNNTIDFAGNATSPANTGITLQTDFDSPHDTTHNTLGSAIPLTLEATTASGDSGGPLLVQTNGTYQIVGVLNGGYSGTGGNVSEYGDRSIWANINQADNFNYLFSAGVAVPEPSTWAAVALGAAGLGVTALRRRARLA